MTDFEAVPSTLLLCFVGRHRGERLVEATKAAGARGGTIALGQSFGHSRILQALSLGDIHQDMVVTLMGRERAAVVQAVRTAAQADPRKLTGMALVLPVPRLFRRVGPCDGPEEHPPEDRSETMDSGYTLITVIVNAGYGESVMAAARQAGASGGTILNARGTGTAEDVKFFGITLVPEKEMLFIVAKKPTVEPIVQAVSAVPQLAEPGGGIMYTMPVEEFLSLGGHKDWQEA